MTQLFLNIMTGVTPEKISFIERLKAFWQNVDYFFTEPGWITFVRFGVLALILFCIVAFIVSGTFLKIVKEEMEKGGEEYGEIAATKVSNRAYLLRVLSVVFIAIIVIGLIITLALI